MQNLMRHPIVNVRRPLQGRFALARTALIAILALFAVPAFSTAKNDTETFPTPEKIARQVWFWEKIFTTYPATTTIIHDMTDPEIILDIIDFKLFAQRFHHGQPFTLHERKIIMDKYLRRYQLAMDRIAHDGKKALSYGAMEQRTFNAYFRSRASAWRVMNRKVTLRTQDGLADEFHRAAERAKDWLPYMEKIFHENGLPADLTRLAFVESMFNPYARSKVGAAGIWQFMDSTARHYMHIDNMIDERQAPIKATRAAARYMAANYAVLGNWPLAVTAYNYGSGGLVTAVNKLKTRNLGTIVERFQNDRFGFASRNFYSEFIAARNVYRDLYAPKNGRETLNPLNIATVSLPHPVSIADLERTTPLSVNILKQYNLCLRPQAFTMYRNRPLPAGYQLVVPKDLESKVKFALGRISPSNAGYRRR